MGDEALLSDEELRTLRGTADTAKSWRGIGPNLRAKQRRPESAGARRPSDESVIAARPDQPRACDERLTREVRAAQLDALRWRADTMRWLQARLRAIRQRAQTINVNRRGPVGADLAHHFELLDVHFGLLRKLDLRGRSGRVQENDVWTYDDFVTMGEASARILRMYDAVQISLPCLCVESCGADSPGRVRVACAVSGSRQVNIVPDQWRKQIPIMQTGIILHESFHASFAELSTDAYSDLPGYPGPDPERNAESYSEFAATVVIGQSARKFPPQQVRAPSPVRSRAR
jgi:hypothetical protein